MADFDYSKEGEAFKDLVKKLSEESQKALYRFTENLKHIEPGTKGVLENFLKANTLFIEFNKGLSNATSGLSDVYKSSGAKGLGQAAGFAATGSAVGSMLGGQLAGAMVGVANEIAAPFKKVFDDGVKAIRQSFEDSVKYSTMTELSAATELTGRKRQTALSFADEAGAALNFADPTAVNNLMQQKYRFEEQQVAGKYSFLDREFSPLSGELGVKNTAKTIGSGALANVGIGSGAVDLNQAAKNISEITQDQKRMNKKY